MSNHSLILEDVKEIRIGTGYVKGNRTSRMLFFELENGEIFYLTVYAKGQNPIHIEGDI